VFNRSVALTTGFGVFVMGLPDWFAGHPTKGDSLLAIVCVAVALGLIAGIIGGWFQGRARVARPREVLPPH
jgi:O-antigen/teichoic acid export membrane protein